MPKICNDLSRYRQAPPVPDGEGWTGSYSVPLDSPVFQGHFPGYPLLPAFVQILMAQHLLESALGTPLTISSLQTAKFTAQVFPGDTLDIRCSPGKEPGLWKFWVHTTRPQLPDESEQSALFQCRFEARQG